MSEDDLAGPGPVIALDGLSGSGKSTLARRLAAELAWAYLDSGAWYRALAWACRERGADCRSSREVLDTLSSIEIHGHDDGTVVVDGHPLQAELRTPEIDRAVADVADHPEVRRELVRRMQRLRNHPHAIGVVADGRDAATVIFPDADLKIFVDASLEARARRRHGQLREAGLERPFPDVLAAMQERDRRDAARGPFAARPAQHGRILENNEASVEEALQRLLGWAEPILDGSHARGARAPDETGT